MTDLGNLPFTELWPRITTLRSPPFVPELKLHLVTAQSPWWTLEPEALAHSPYRDPYWAFCWPGGAGLARYLFALGASLKGRTVYDIGTGCGIVALAAARCGAHRVIANDIDPWALEASARNADANHLTLELSAENLVGTSLPEESLVVLGDMLYAPEQSQEVLAWGYALRSRGCTVLFADPCRGYGLPQASAKAWFEVAAEVDPGDGTCRAHVGIWELDAP